MIYKEKQKFTQPLIWVGLIFSGMITIGIFSLGYYIQIIRGQKFGNNPMSDNALIISLILVIFLFLSVLLLFGFANLTTVIDKRGIGYRFFPFHFKFHRIDWEMIEKFDVITYKPIREYGGWGIRLGKAGTAYNVSGDKGLKLKLNSGKNILIGTQKQTELTDFLTRLMNVLSHTN